MSNPWVIGGQQGESSLESTLSDFLTFDTFDRLDPLEPALDAIQDTTSVPSDATFDWSSGIDPSSLCLFPDPEAFAVDPPPEHDNICDELPANEQNLKEVVQLLGNRLDQVERGMEMRLARIEENIGDVCQRLTKLEAAKAAQDIEIELRKEKIRTESKKLLDELQEYRNLANMAAERLVGPQKKVR